MKKCVICNKNYYGEGNDASPLESGECCDQCFTAVKAERISRLHSDYHMQELLKKYSDDVDNKEIIN